MDASSRARYLPTMEDDMPEARTEAKAEFDQMHQRLVTANNRFAQGDATPWKELCSHAEDVTLFGGAGGYEHGWEHVGPRYSWASSNFSGGRMTSELPATHLDGDRAC